jgi:hypothetical protein
MNRKTILASLSAHKSRISYWMCFLTLNSHHFMSALDYNPKWHTPERVGSSSNQPHSKCESRTYNIDSTNRKTSKMFTNDFIKKSTPDQLIYTQLWGCFYAFNVFCFLCRWSGIYLRFRSTAIKSNSHNLFSDFIGNQYQARAGHVISNSWLDHQIKGGAGRSKPIRNIRVNKNKMFILYPHCK